jgi:hypothetical protein
MVGNSCPTSDTRRATLVTNSVISHECGKDGVAITTNPTGIPYHMMFVFLSVTQRVVQLVEQELLTLPFICGIHVPFFFIGLQDQNFEGCH